MKHHALILVDIQQDFLPNGSLAVPHGDEVIPIANAHLDKPYGLKIATRDQHPPNHISFATTHNLPPFSTLLTPHGPQTLWPSHCVENTPGSTPPSSLHTEKIPHCILKAQAHHVDAYSPFFNQHHQSTPQLHNLLQQHQIHTLHILGLALDYCVYHTCLDALTLGYRVELLLDGCRAVNPQDGRDKVEHLRSLGVTCVHLNERPKDSSSLQKKTRT